MSAEGLELRPARWQFVGMTLAPTVCSGAFVPTLWFLVGGPWGRLAAAALAAFGLLTSYLNYRRMSAARVCVNAEGVRLEDGSRAGHYDQHARWSDVARCAVEKRHVNGRNGRKQPCLILSDAGNDLFGLYLRYLSRADNARLLRFIKVELERRNLPFGVPAELYGH